MDMDINRETDKDMDINMKLVASSLQNLDFDPNNRFIPSK
jgi:hypothetical protein